MKKILKIIGLLLLVLIVTVVILVTVFTASTVRTLVQTAVPPVIGAPVELADVSIRPIRGLVRLEGFVIGNPEGFNTESAIKLGEFKLDLDPRSVFTDTIIIREVLIDGPEITYEMSIKGSNIGAILKNLEGEPKAEGAPEEPEPKPDPDAKPAKKVIVEHLLIQNGKIKVSSKILQGKALSIPLPKVEMTDIGKEKEGASPKEIVTGVFKAIAGAATGAVTGAGKLVGSGLKAGAGLAADAGGAAVDVGKAGAEAVGGGLQAGAGLAADAGGAAIDAGKAGAEAVGTGAKAVGTGAKKAAGAVGSGAKKTVGAVGSGASKVIGGVTGIFRKKDEDETDEVKTDADETDSTEEE